MRFDREIAVFVATVLFASVLGVAGVATYESDGVTVVAGKTCTTAGATTCDINGLTNGTAYTFKVTATNVAGTSAESTVSAAVTPIAAPDTPSGVAGVSGDTDVTVSWTAPADNGAAITDYSVATYESDGTTVVIGKICTTTGATNCTITGLANGTAYRFKVNAVNVAGTSAESAVSAVVVPATLPDAPTGVAGVFGDAQVAVSWTAPADDGGAAVTSYTVMASPDGATCSGGSTSCVVPGLTNGTAYTFTVTAANSAGTSSTSDPSAAVVPAEVSTDFCWESQSHPFGDVAGSSYSYDDVGCLYSLGVTTGTSATTYSPDAAVTREHTAAFLARMVRAIAN